MSKTMHKFVLETATFLRQKTDLRPRLGFVLGSGLSGFAKEVKVDVEIPYAATPHFSVSSVEGHPGKLIIGTLQDIPVVVMSGRLHAYEGLSLQQVVFPIRTLASFGVKTLVVTNAAGGLSPKMRAGDFMIILDHLNMTGDNPLRGPNVPLGPRFVDMSEPYDQRLSTALFAAVKKARGRAHAGVYVGVLGPTYETRAEIKFFAKMGGGAVGMSTVAEVIAARHAGLRVAGLSCITNLGTGLSKKHLTHDDVKAVAHKMETQFTAALLHFTQKIKRQI